MINADSVVFVEEGAIVIGNSSTFNHVHIIKNCIILAKFFLLVQKSICSKLYTYVCMYIPLSQNRPSRFCHHLKQSVWNFWNSTLMINLGEWCEVWRLAWLRLQLNISYLNKSSTLYIWLLHCILREEIKYKDKGKKCQLQLQKKIDLKSFKQNVK